MYTPHLDTMIQSAREHRRELLHEAEQRRLTQHQRKSFSLSRLLQPVIIRLADTLIASGQRLKASF